MADGPVSYSGSTLQGSDVVYLEHGLGFSPFYAQNKRNAVKARQRMKRGDLVGYVGSTDTSTGPKIDYEIGDRGKNVNPQKFLQGGS